MPLMLISRNRCVFMSEHHLKPLISACAANWRKFHPFCNVFLSFSSVFLKKNKIVTCLEWLWIVERVPNNTVCLNIISPYHSKETSYIQPKWMHWRLVKGRKSFQKNKICCFNRRCCSESRQDKVFSIAASQKTAFVNPTILIFK